MASGRVTFKNRSAIVVLFEIEGNQDSQDKN